jgi:hypothetical protein
MSESILQEWETMAQNTSEYPDRKTKNFRIRALLARDKIMREALQHIVKFGGDLEKHVARENLAEADQILGTTNKGEIK